MYDVLSHEYDVNNETFLRVLNYLMHIVSV